MTRDELEAVVRRSLTRAVTANLELGRVDTGALNLATDMILQAADAYGLTEHGVTADRRKVLAALPNQPRRNSTYQPPRGGA